MRQAETAFADLLRHVDLLLDRKGNHEEQADVVADLLAFLAERMTELHRERQEETRSFLEWLEERLQCRIEDLDGHTRIETYHEGSVDQLLRVIEKNYPSKVALSVAAPVTYKGRNPDRENIISGYEKSMERLRPLLHQIELTDRLIDLVVYRLYGLTPEEIELVEGRV